VIGEAKNVKPACSGLGPNDRDNAEKKKEKHKVQGTTCDRDNSKEPHVSWKMKDFAPYV